MPVKGKFNSQKQCSCLDEDHKVNKLGITYYQLGEISGSTMYPNDVTQGCSLYPNQVDANFNFLHGDDIKSGKFDRKEKAMVLDRHFDSKEMAIYAKEHPEIGPIKISTEGILDGSFDASREELTLVFNGSEVVITGVTIKDEITLPTDKVYIKDDIKLGDTSLANFAKEVYLDGIIPKGATLQDVLTTLFGLSPDKIYYGYATMNEIYNIIK